MCCPRRIARNFSNIWPWSPTPAATRRTNRPSEASEDQWSAATTALWISCRALTMPGQSGSAECKASGPFFPCHIPIQCTDGENCRIHASSRTLLPCFPRRFSERLVHILGESCAAILLCLVLPAQGVLEVID